MQNFKTCLEFIFNYKIYLIPLWIAIVLSFPALIPREYELIPNRGNLSYSLFNDAAKGGGSEITDAYLDSTSLTLSYILSSDHTWPYVGIHTDLDPKERFTDLSVYDRLHLTVKSKKPTNIQVHIRTHQDGIDESLYEKPTSQRYNLYRFECLDSVEKFSVDLSVFTTPRWWIVEEWSSQGYKHLPPPDYRRSEAIVIMTDGTTPIEREHSFTITELRLDRDIPKRISKLLMSSLIYILFWSLLSQLWRYLRSREKTTSGDTKKLSPAAPKPLTLEEESKIATEKISKYLSENYTNDQLSLEMVSAFVGFHRKKVSLLIKDTYGLSFKQYLNSLRLTEAKRLLKETGSRISDIATAVGYSNVTHFNRVFKEVVNMSPKDYRLDEKTGPTKSDKP